MKRRTFLGVMAAPMLIALVDGSARPASAFAGTSTASVHPLAATAGRPTFRVGAHRGAPCIFVDDAPRFPMYLFEQEVSVADGQTFTDAGVEFYSFIEKDSFLDLGWTGASSQDFTVIDRVMQTFEDHVPNGYALPRLHLWAPGWWLDAHPDDVVDYAIDPGTAGIPRDASFASTAWRTEAGAKLRTMVRHILDGPQGDRTMGVTIAGGLYGEWLCYNAEYLPDTSEAMRTAWIGHLKAKYSNSVAQLRAAWGDPAVTFDTVVIPGTGERRETAVGLFRDPAASRRVLDYYDSHHRVVVEAIDHFASIVKDESGGALLTSVLYGYTPDQGYMPQEQHHRAVAALHRLDSVDLVTSPHSYYRRAPGDDGAYRTYTDSLALHGKLFIDEADDRTHLAPAGTSFVYATTMAESLGIIRRAFGQAVTHATGMWYMDHSSGLWYADPAMGAEFARLKHWGDYSMNVSRSRASQVAMISVPTAELVLGGETDTTAKLYEGPSLGSRQGIGELSRAGAPFDRYTIDDLVDGLVPTHYKVYVFPDAFRLNAAQRTAINALKSGGRTLVWGWAPGYASDSALARADVEALTGFSLTQVTAPAAPAPDPNTPLDDEDFETGSFAGTGYTGGAGGSSGSIITTAGEVIGGTRSVKGSAPATTDWHEYLYTKPASIPLEANATYRVKFRGRTITAPGAGAYFYFVARTGSGGVPQDVGSNQWSDAPGAVYSKEFEFTLKNYSDYYLIWGIHDGGAMTVDDITITKVKNAGLPPMSYRLDAAAFPGITETFGGEIALEPLFLPTGSGFTTLARSAESTPRPVIARKALTGWTSVLASTPPIPSPVLRKLYVDAGVHVYTGGDDNLEANAAWISLHAKTAGTKTVTLPTPGPLYDTGSGTLLGLSATSATFTMAKGDTVLLTRSNPLVTGGVLFGFETGSFATSHFTGGFGGSYGTITSTPSQVISGTRSAYGAAPATTDWYEFLYSNPTTIALAADASYTVDFVSKTGGLPGSGGHFYFLARSQAAGAPSDRGVTSWTDPVGTVRKRSVTFTTGNHTDYRLIWGLHNGGALSVDDILISRND